MNRQAKAPSAFTPARASLLALSICAVALLAIAPAATAAPKTLNGFVGGPSTPFSGFNGNHFSQPRDVAVYEGADNDLTTDKLFTVEGSGSGQRVKRLDAHGNFERAWGKDMVAPAAPGDSGTGFEICTLAIHCGGGQGGALKGELNNPSSIAVDQANAWVYVWDRANNRVQKFGLDGNFILAFGKGVNASTGGDICTEASGDTCGAGVTTPTGAAGVLNGATGQPKLAVSPTNGHVFATDPANRRVSEFDQDGAFLRAWGWDVDPTTADTRFEVCTTSCQAGQATGATSNGAYAAGNPINVAVDSQNVVYSTDTASGTVANRIIRFDADLAPGSPGDATAALLQPINPTTAPAFPPAPNPLLAGLLSPSNEVAPNGIEIDPDADGAGPEEESLIALRDPASPTSAPTVVQELDIPTAPGEMAADDVAVTDTHTFAAQPARGSIAAGANGVVYVPIQQSGTFPAFGDCKEAGSQSTCSGLITLATASGPLAATATTPTPAEVGATTATLAGTVNPGGGTASYQLEVSFDGGSFSPAGAPGYATGFGPVPVSREVTGLQAGASYAMRIKAHKFTSLTAPKEQATSASVTFATDAAPPDVKTLSSAKRTTTGATLRAFVDANGGDTSYHFIYGEAGGVLDQRLPAVGEAGPVTGTVSQLVTLALTGLDPDTEYEYRVVASNAAGDVEGDTVGFFTLIDHLEPEPRVYELVSPAEKVGGQGVGIHAPGDVAANSIGEGPSVDGERYGLNAHAGGILLDSPFAYANDIANADRTPTGWVSHSPVRNRDWGNAQNRFLQREASSEDLEVSTYATNGGHLNIFPEVTALHAPWEVLYLGDWEGRWEVFGPTSPSTQTNPVSVQFVSAVSAEGTHAVLSSNLKGLSGPGDPTLDQADFPISSPAVYIDDVSAGLSDSFPGEGIREPVGVCTPGTLLPSRLASGKLAERPCPAPVEYAPGQFRDAALLDLRGAKLGEPIAQTISRDGSRVFFTTMDNSTGGTVCAGVEASTTCPAQLFARIEDESGEVAVRWISRPTVANQDASLLAETRFEGATPDGDKVYFSTTSPLTADDPNGQLLSPSDPRPILTGAPSNNSRDLFEYDFSDDPGDDPGAGTLTRISAGPDGKGDGSYAQLSAGAWALRFVSEDGSRVYFATSAPLPGVPAPTSGTTTSPGGSASSQDFANLYLYERAKPTAERWSFIARLPRATALGTCATTGGTMGSVFAADGNNVDVLRSDRVNCLTGSADGALVAFLSDGRLTADDPDAVTGDIYAYDAEAGELARISAPQGGPGGSYTCVTHNPAGYQCTAGNIGGAQMGLISDPAQEGRRTAFFNSKSRLVAADTDDGSDAYQWRDGELSLLSTGTAKPAYYAGASADGQDVFIATRERLSWQDVDDVMDVYDARIGGGIPEPIDPPDCEVLADGCQGAAVAAPAAAAASTGAFAGEGNFKADKGSARKPCRKGKVRRRGRCVAKRKPARAKRKQSKQKNRANAERRAGR